MNNPPAPLSGSKNREYPRADGTTTTNNTATAQKHTGQHVVVVPCVFVPVVAVLFVVVPGPGTFVELQQTR